MPIIADASFTERRRSSPFNLSLDSSRGADADDRAFIVSLVPDLTTDVATKICASIQAASPESHVRDVALIKPGQRHSEKLRSLFTAEEPFICHTPTRSVQRAQLQEFPERRVVRPPALQYVVDHQRSRQHTTNLFNGQCLEGFSCRSPSNLEAQACEDSPHAAGAPSDRRRARRECARG
jgi:hypothetical protein